MADVKIYATVIEDEAKQQVELLSQQKSFCDQKIRIMPDCHVGKGCVIGFTSTIGDYVIPNIVGVDIGCFTGDTKVSLLSGENETLKNLYEEGKEVWVYSLDNNLKFVPAKAMPLQTRKLANLLEVMVSGGEKIRCTPDHKFMMLDGSYKEAKDLISGDSLMPLYRTYQTRDGYEYLKTAQDKGLTHKKVAEFIYGKNNVDGKAVHHLDVMWWNNTPGNLEILTHSAHSKLHRKLNTSFINSDFQDKKMKTINERGWYYDEKHNQTKKTIGIENIQEYMNSEKWKDDFKNNGKRGYKYLEKLNYSHTCEICGKICGNKGAYGRHIKSHGVIELLNVCNNHKVLYVKEIQEKEDVYCLSVPRYNNFALASGVFVHNCGMNTVELGKIDLDLQNLDNIIRQYIPSGRNVHEGRVYKYDKLQTLKCFREIKDTKRLERSIGTLGGGNHFIEIDQDDVDNKYLVIHTGSRNLGKQVADYYQNLAYDLLCGKDKLLAEQEKLIVEYKAQGRRSELQQAIKELKAKYKAQDCDIPKDLAYLTGKYKDDYLHDMAICQEYAEINRAIIAKIIIDKSEMWRQTAKTCPMFETIHNYIDIESGIIRKGAINADKGKRLLIPLNMRDGCIIGIGKGNPDWNNSAPHGAGRIMSRMKVKAEFSMEEYRNSMEGIFTTSVCEDTLDELPMAYKNMSDIIDVIGDTVEIEKIIKPVYNYKASE